MHRGARLPATDPILVYGAPRSGTTYLREILDVHPNVTLTHEMRVFTWLHDAVQSLQRAGDALFRGRDDDLASIRGHLPALARSLYEGLGEAARWWGDKYPHYAQEPGILRTAAALFPGARFVHIHRDPRAALASLMQKQHPDGSPWIGLEDAHVMVVGHVQNAIAFAAECGPGSAYTIRYETLVQDDLAGARDLFAWLDIPMAEPVEALCRAQAGSRTAFSGPTSDLSQAGSRTQAVAAWQRVIPAGQQRESLQFLAPLLLSLGYETEASLDALNHTLPA